MPYKRNGKWLGQIRLDGTTYRKTFQTKSQAQEWEVKQRRAAPRSAEKETPSTCLLDWATKYLSFSQSKFVKSTFDEKRVMFQRFLHALSPELPAEKVRPGMILSFLQEQNNSRSGYSANKDRKNLVAAWNWGIKYMGLPSPNPCLVERFPEERQKRYVPPQNHFWRVYEVAESPQDAVMLLAFLHLAARRGELFNLRWEDVDFAESKVRLLTRKRKDGSLEADWLPMTEKLFNALLLHKQDSDSEWVFPNPDTGIAYFERNKWMRRLCEKAGVKPFGLHSIRHLTASILAQDNVSLLDIQTMLRHRKLATTERYISRLSSLRPALRVLEGGGPKSHQVEPPNKKRDCVVTRNP